MSFIDDSGKALFKTVSGIIKNKKVTAANVVYLTGVVMEVVEKEQSLEGNDKKVVVVNILKEIVRLSPSIKEEEKDLLYMSIDNLVPGAIDLIVAGASGQLNINIQPLLSKCGCFGAPKQPPEQTGAKDLMNSNVRKAKK